MADTQNSHTHAAEPPVKTYLVIFVALAVFTVISFIANGMANSGSITKTTSFVIILGVAVCKALLVGMYFMHLKYDWNRLYFVIIPVVVLCVMMMIVLLPDIVLGWHNYPENP